MFVFFGNQLKKIISFPMQRSLRWSLVKSQKEQSQIRESEQLIHLSLTLGLLHWPLKAATSASLRTISCLQQDVFRTPRNGIWWPDQVFRNYVVVCAISITSRQWRHLTAFDSSSQRYSIHYRVDVIAGAANAAAYKYYKKQKYQDLYNSSVAVMLRELQREVNMDRPFESRLHIDYSTNNHHSQLRSADYPDGSWIFSHGVNRLDPELWELWSNTRERTKGKEKEGTSWGQLLSQGYWSYAQRNSSEELSRSGRYWQSNDCSQDYEIHQSGQVLEVQNRDFWIRPTDLSWHFPILVTIRELPLKNYCGRSLAKLEARDEAKKQKT